MGSGPTGALQRFWVRANINEGIKGGCRVQHTVLNEGMEVTGKHTKHTVGWEVNRDTHLLLANQLARQKCFFII